MELTIPTPQEFLEAVRAYQSAVEQRTLWECRATHPIAPAQEVLIEVKYQGALVAEAEALAALWTFKDSLIKD